MTEANVPLTDAQHINHKPGKQAYPRLTKEPQLLCSTALAPVLWKYMRMDMRNLLFVINELPFMFIWLFYLCGIPLSRVRISLDLILLLVEHKTIYKNFWGAFIFVHFLNKEVHERQHITKEKDFYNHLNRRIFNT